jgi:hypothetical protein
MLKEVGKEKRLLLSNQQNLYQQYLWLREIYY